MLFRLSAPAAALLALSACATETITAMEEDPQHTEEVPADVVEPWANPLEGGTSGEPLNHRTVRDMLAAQNAGSTRNARDGNWKGAKMRFRWVDGDSYDVVLAKDRITSLVLFPGEGFNNYAYGDEYFGPELKPTWAGTRDAGAMAYGPAQTAVPITPWVVGRCTDLTVYTTWRTILLDVCSTGTKKAYNKIVEWWMPGEELRRFKAAVQAGAAPGPGVEPASGMPTAEMKVHYEPTEAPADWRADEWVAFSDGKRTYAIPPADLGFEPVPAVRVAGAGNTPLFRKLPRRDGDGFFFQIDALPSEVVMVHGDDTLTLRRVGA